MVMFRKSYRGIAIVEVLMVLAISAGLFVFAIAAFSTRARTAKDEAARQVMSQIALVRNEAQQGRLDTPSDISGGNELFGKAIIFDGNRMLVYVLQQSQTGARPISVAGEPTIINLSDGLIWQKAFPSPPNCNRFYSCFKTADNYRPLSNWPISIDETNQNIMMVFRNRTGNGYVFAANVARPLAIGSAASQIQQYQDNRQVNLRMAFGAPDNSAQYYANFDLTKVGDQSLEIVK